MNRLQKKCLIATTGMHLALVLLVVFSSAFFSGDSKPDESQIITVIPDRLIDEAFSSGVRNAAAPPPNPDPPATPPIPVPVPKPPEPVPTPRADPVPPAPERVPQTLPKPDEPAEPAPKPRREIKVDKNLVTRSASTPADTSRADARRDAQRERDQRAQAIRSALVSINKNTSSATTVDMPGASTAAYASYKDALASIFYDAWTPPENATNDNAITKVRIIIARDGKILSAQIIGASGDSAVDASVRRVLDRVTSVPPLPDGTKESQRSVTLNFNLKTKRMIG